MNYAYAAIGLVLILWGGYESIQAADAQRDLATLKYSYDQAVQVGQARAKDIEAKQDAEIKARTDSAVTLAATAASKANASRASYDAKLKELARQKPADLPHLCSTIPIPGDLIP